MRQMVFIAKIYCSLNMFRALLCPSSGAQEYYTDDCCLWYLVLWFSSCRSGVELWVVCPVCGMLYAHHQELKIIIQMVAACGTWCFGFHVVGLVWSCELCVRFVGCCSIQLHIRPTTWKPKPQHEIPQAATICIILLSSWWWAYSIPQTGHTTHSSTPDRQLENQSTKYHRQQPLYITLELLMMGIIVPETCWANNKYFCNKKPSVASSWHFISTYSPPQIHKGVKKWSRFHAIWRYLRKIIWEQNSIWTAAWNGQIIFEQHCSAQNMAAVVLNSVTIVGIIDVMEAGKANLLRARSSFVSSHRRKNLGIYPFFPHFSQFNTVSV